jgi:hypothetical protein
MVMKVCKKCGVEKEISEFGILSSSYDGKRHQCKKCVNFYLKKNRSETANQRKSSYNKLYRIKNREVINEKIKIYYEKNPDKKVKGNLEYFRSYHSNRYKIDILFKLSKILRSRINKIVKLNNINKKTKTFDIVGCSSQFLKEYLENKFTEGMSWDNYGVYGWHIDHIIALSSAKTEEEICKLGHYTNLQPLWAEDNLKKSNKHYL